MTPVPQDDRGPLGARWQLVVGIVASAALLTLTAAVLCTPALVERYLSSDGAIGDSTRRTLLALQTSFAVVTLGLTGLASWLRRHTPQKERVATGLALSLVSTVVLLAVAEGIARAWHHLHPVRADRHFFMEYDALLGWRQRPHARAVFKGTLVEINARGLRERDLDVRASPASRILMLGDSQLFGDGVEVHETFARRLEDLVAGIRTVNAGVIGYGTDQQVLFFERDGAAHAPTLVIVALNAYDLLDNISAQVRSGYRKPFFHVRGAALELANVPVPRDSLLEVAARSVARASQLGWWLRSLEFHGGVARIGDESLAGRRWTADEVFPPGSDFDRALDVTQRLLERLAARARQAGATPLVVFLPYAMDYQGDAGYQSRVDRLLDGVRGSTRTAGFGFVDLRQPLRTGSQGLFLDSMHFSPAGHDRVAAALATHVSAAIAARSRDAGR